MNASFTGTRFDGETLEARAVTVEVAAGRLHLRGLELPEDYSLADVQASDRLAHVPRFLYLPERRTVETMDHDAVDALVALQQRGRWIALVHWLEVRSHVAAGATVLLAVAVAAIIYFGLPVVAEQTAYAVPMAVDDQAGRTALAAFNRFLAPSQLEFSERVRVDRLAGRLAALQHPARKVRVEFRSMGGKFPNAFALPGGIIVISDELVKLADNDEEIMAVLAHELGHLEHRHALQSVLRGSAALLVVSAVTGDLSTLTSFSAAIPLMLLQRGYSREFETEADSSAVTTLRAARVDPAFFASILEKLEKSRGDARGDYSYLSTHPSSADRIKRINPDGHRPVGLGKKPKASFVAPAETPARLPNFGGKNAPANLGLKLAPGQVAPEVLERPQPAYPAMLALASVEGAVQVEFIIDVTGAVTAPRVISSTHKDFEAPALAAIQRWKFKPGTLHGIPIAVKVSQSIEFHLEDAPFAPTKR